jgi:hypothetical protein
MYAMCPVHLIPFYLITVIVELLII